MTTAKQHYCILMLIDIQPDWRERTGAKDACFANGERETGLRARQHLVHGHQRHLRKRYRSCLEDR